MSKRIDSLTTGDIVTLTVHPSRFNGGYVMKDVIFDHMESAGDTRRAVFSETGSDSDKFEVYRFNKRWAIASDARRVTLVS